MKVILITEYVNVDNNWLTWYISKLRFGHVPIDIEKFISGEQVSFTSTDPTSNVIATTMYQLERDDLK